ncbi:hypothetical protein KEJ37_07650 [Candidatus Bathyarchaeota archaeon]|nr:hypothetical protein [Candidatus Bathyarchaeota archaeon]
MSESGKIHGGWIEQSTAPSPISAINPLKIYIYVIFVNPDGSKDFSPYRYNVIEDLYMGETATFSINSEVYQTIQIFLAYLELPFNQFMRRYVPIFLNIHLNF